METLLDNLIDRLTQYNLTVKSGYINVRYFKNFPLELQHEDSLEIKDGFTLLEYSQLLGRLGYYPLEKEKFFEIECIIYTDKATLVLDCIEDIGVYYFKLTEI